MSSDALPGGRWRDRLLRTGGRLLERLLAWLDRANQRHRLAMLDDRMLKDIGLTRAEVTYEVQKPFWTA